MEKGRISAFCAFTPAAGERLCLGAPVPDQILGGGLEMRRLHEIVPEGIFHLGAAAGFALALAAMAGGGDAVWIQQRLAALEGGAPYGPGSAIFGIVASRWLIVETASAKDALWAMEESLRCPGVGAVVAELCGTGEAADLTATRRLNLVLQERQGRTALGLLLRQRPLMGSACATRWRVASAPGSSDRLGGIGRPAFALTLEKNRHGPCGGWRLEWNHEQRNFHAALPVALAAAPGDRSYRAA